MHLSPEQLQPRVGGPRGLKDAHTRVCPSQLLPQAGGGTPQSARAEPLPRGRRPPLHVPLGGGGVREGLTSREASANRSCPLNSPGGIPWSQPGSGVTPSAVE